MKKKLKGTLFDKSRFQWLEEERLKELKSMTIAKANKMQEAILIFNEKLKKKFDEDNPVSLEILLKSGK